MLAGKGASTGELKFENNKNKKEVFFSFRGGGSGGVGCLDGVWVWISPIAKRSKSSNDLGRGRGDPGLNLGGACFFRGMFF